MEKECPFCDIDTSKTEILEDNNLYYVALSNPRLVDGHLLVIPKRHIEMPWELLPEERVVLLDTVIRYQEIITRKFTQGVDMRQNYRPFLPQGRVKVDHMHYHIYPRNLNDELFTVSSIHEKDLWQDLTPEYKARFRILYIDTPGVEG